MACPWAMGSHPSTPVLDARQSHSGITYGLFEQGWARRETVKGGDNKKVQPGKDQQQRRSSRS